MEPASPFDELTDRYDRWFEANEAVYRAELTALDRLVSPPGFGLEIGVGTGRFADPLGLEIGLDPSVEMLNVARDRGIETVAGVAEHLPFAANRFDTAVLVTTICFVDDILETVAEASRVLTSDGALVIGYVDQDSPLGRQYEDKREENPFYREATFVSTAELIDALEAGGFSVERTAQTLFHPLDEVDVDEPVASGYGEGSFVTIRATKSG